MGKLKEFMLMIFSGNEPCPYCNSYDTRKIKNLTAIHVRFKCLNCRKSRKIELELPKYKSDNPLNAREFLIKYNEELRIIKTKI